MVQVTLLRSILVFFPNTNALAAINKSRRAAKRFCNKILQFLPQANPQNLLLG